MHARMAMPSGAVATHTAWRAPAKHAATASDECPLESQWGSRADDSSPRVAVVSAARRTIRPSSRSSAAGRSSVPRDTCMAAACDGSEVGVASVAYVARVQCGSAPLASRTSSRPACHPSGLVPAHPPRRARRRAGVRAPRAERLPRLSAQILRDRRCR